MKLHPVESSNISALGYDEKTGELHVKFNSGTQYAYAGVPLDTYEELIQAESIGSFFYHHIKGKYGGRKA